MSGYRHEPDQAKGGLREEVRRYGSDGDRWLVLLLPAVFAQEAGLAVTPMDGGTVTAGDLVDALVGTGVSTSNVTYNDPSHPTPPGCSRAAPASSVSRAASC